MTVVALGPEHVPAAARLVAAEVGRQRAHVPVLPGAWEDPAVTARVVARLVDQGAGLAVLDDGELVAFQAALLIDGHGGRWAYTPDLGHAAPGRLGDRLRERLYADLADSWVRTACVEHVISVPADDDVAQATLARLGFGQHVVDLVGGLEPVDAGDLPPGLAVRRAAAADAAAVAELETALRRHLQASPIFVRTGPAPAPEVGRRLLEDASTATFVAVRDGLAVAFLRIGPCSTDVAMIVRDPSTASVTAAFTRPDLRGTGIIKDRECIKLAG